MENLGVGNRVDQIREVSDREFAAVPIRTGLRKTKCVLSTYCCARKCWSLAAVDGDPRQQSDSADPLVAVPHHRYLLDTDFTVNDELVKKVTQ